MSRLATRRIALAGDRAAVAVAVLPTTGGEAIARALRLKPKRGLVVLTAGTAETGQAPPERIREALATVAGLAAEKRLTLLDGGTAAGLIPLLGGAVDARAVEAYVGVTVDALVTWPGRDAVGTAGGPAAARLEPHHTHLVLVQAASWGEETPAFLALADALDRSAPSVAVVAGGGDIAALEVMGHARAGRPILVLEGSGRLADDLAAYARHGAPLESADLADALAGAEIEVVPLDAGREELLDVLRRRLRPRAAGLALFRNLPTLRPRRTPPEPILPPGARAAFPELADDLAAADHALAGAFQRLDAEALRAQNQFRLERIVLIVGGALATILGAVQTALTSSAWPGIVEAVLGALLTALVLRAQQLRARERYYETRLRAERLRGEYFLFVCRAEEYAVADDPGSLLARRALDVELEVPS